MPPRLLACLAVAGLLVTSAGTAFAQSRPSESAEQNVRESRQYEQLVCSNPGFRAKRMARECGPLTDPQLKQSCEASFACGAGSRRGSQHAPPSETIR